MSRPMVDEMLEAIEEALEGPVDGWVEQPLDLDVDATVPRIMLPQPHPGDVTIERVQAGRCSGECCRLITLSATAEQIAEMAARHRYLRRVGVSDNWSPDAVYVEENFIPVRMSYVDGVTGRRLSGRWHTLPEPAQQYRCRQWDGRRCLDYENRPPLCQSYGSHTQRCVRPECTLRWTEETLAHHAWEDDGGATREEC